MNLYKVTIFDYFFDMELSGKFEAETAAEAETIAREVYAEDLGTTPDEIDVVDVTEIVETEKDGAPTTAHHPAKGQTLHHEEEQFHIMPQTEKKINLGQVFTTPSVSDEMSRNDWFRFDIHAAVGKFTAGDWGECFESDAEFNDQVLDAGDDKIIGVYDTQAGRVWVVAEPWREATTILFESEY